MALETEQKEHLGQHLVREVTEGTVGLGKVERIESQVEPRAM